MIFRDAIRSLKEDKSRTFFYWMTYFLTSMFIFLFFNILMSNERGVEMIVGGTDFIATFIIIIVVVICLLCIQFANNFYVRSKGKDIAVRLVCGATFNKITAYLFAQTVIIILLSIPLGILAGILLIPVLNAFLVNFTSADFTIGIHSYANMIVAILIGMILMWSTAVNLSFTYTNAAFSLMTNDGSYSSKEGGTFGTLLAKIPLIVKQIFFTAVLIVPLVLMFNPEVSKLTLSLMGLIGVWGVINFVIIPWISQSMDKVNINRPQILAGNGFLRKDFDINKSSIILFIACAVVQISIIAERQEQIFDSLLFTFSFVLMNFMLAMMIMFKSMTEQTSRRRYYRVLNQIGFEENRLKAITKNEVVKLYGITAGISLLYIGAMLLSLSLSEGMSKGLLILLLSTLIIPIMLCLLINIYTYRKAVLSDLGKPR